MADRSLHDRICALPGESVDHRTFDVEPVSHPARADLAPDYLGVYAHRYESGVSFDHGAFLLSAWNDAGAHLGNLPV